MAKIPIVMPSKERNVLTLFVVKEFIAKNRLSFI